MKQREKLTAEMIRKYGYEPRPCPDSFDGFCSACQDALDNHLRCRRCDGERRLEYADVERKRLMEDA